MDSLNENISGNGMPKESIPVLSGDETILVVDDHDIIRSFLYNSLKMFGYSIICAIDGVDGLKKYSENKDKIDISLLDLVMPQKNGIELYHEIKKLEPNAKVLFMSGGYYNNKEYPLNEITCFSKPIDIKKLLREIRTTLDK